MTRRVGIWLAAAVTLFLTAACGSNTEARTEPNASDGLRVASFNFAESALLAEMYAQAIEAAGVPVVRLGAIGPREIIAPAMELDRVDLVPEYLGTALQYAGSSEPNPDTESARTDLNDRLASRGLSGLAASPAQDKNVFVVTAETARQHNLVTISDLSATATDQRFGGTAECPDRPLCLAGLEAVYGLQFAEFVPQRSLEFTAEALRRGEIEVGLMFSTASEMAGGSLVELIDDLSMQPAENIIPVVRVEALERWGPEVAAAANAVSRLITTADLRLLNQRVAYGETVEHVARDWLMRSGLLSPD